MPVTLASSLKHTVLLSILGVPQVPSMLLLLKMIACYVDGSLHVISFHKSFARSGQVLLLHSLLNFLFYLFYFFPNFLMALTTIVVNLPMAILFYLPVNCLGLI